MRDGFRVVLAGAVNVGKSSLLNRLAMRDAAIVSEQAGTTRDIIEIHMDLGGYPVIIQDTAGIRPTDNKVETIGIARSKSAMDKADLIVAVGDHLCPSQDISSLCPVGKNLIHVRNKIDIAPHEGNDENVFAISVLKDEGVDALIAAIAEMVKEGFTQRESGLILRLRHRDHLEKCLDALARIGAHGEDEVDLMGEDIREAAAHVGAITGKIDVEDMLDRVFSEFCIGK
ncbi:MAG: hypothetical protein C0605_01060 [Hyphomicrobiales bacterium]|nr:MAG: hypothetical protein C0605_01060 [Hyphomicrobiales bacterium]